jgi:nucleoside-diphosphate-sugar epimerase
MGRWGRVVVTGGTGCIGTAVLRLLRSLGTPQVTSIADRRPTREAVVAGVEYLDGDVTDAKGMTALLGRLRPELVVHLAGVRDPGQAEIDPIGAVRTNVVGTEVVLRACRSSGVDVTVAASTGKAMRLYTSDVYASTKQLVEYQVARAGVDGVMATGCARFTHVVDNSLIYGKLRRWASTGEPVRLHGPSVDLYVQSAREAAELLLSTAAMARSRPGSGRITAIGDLGWPPIDLLGLAMDVVREEHSDSSIVSVGFPAGYEESVYPGTLDPWTSGDHSPLLNALEVARPPGAATGLPSIDSTDVVAGSGEVDAALVSLEATLRAPTPEAVRQRLAVACMAMLRWRLACAPEDAVASMFARGRSYGAASGDHWLIDLVTDRHLRTERPSRRVRRDGDADGVRPDRSLVLERR